MFGMDHRASSQQTRNRAIKVRGGVVGVDYLNIQFVDKGTKLCNHSVGDTRLSFQFKDPQLTAEQAKFTVFFQTGDVRFKIS